MINGLYDVPVPDVYSNAGGNTVKYPMYVTWYYLIQNNRIPITSTLIHSMVPEDEKRISRAKVAQCLKRLAQCGYFTREQQGRSYLYYPTEFFHRTQAMIREAVC